MLWTVVAMWNDEYEADAYDITCRVCDDWEFANVSPGIAAMQLMLHSEFHDTKELGGPWWAMRVRKGYKGLDEDRAVQTPEDGWNRSPELKANP